MATSLSTEQIQALATVIATVTSKSSSAGTEEEWLTVREAEKRYKISRWTLRRLRRAGKIIAKKFTQSKSGKVLISKKSMELFLNASDDFIGAKA